MTANNLTYTKVKNILLTIFREKIDHKQNAELKGKSDKSFNTLGFVPEMSHTA